MPHVDERIEAGSLKIIIIINRLNGILDGSEETDFMNNVYGAKL